ncbi:MAG: efflux RND transporter permease subunit, partial [Flavobacteriaceae bacterium]
MVAKLATNFWAVTARIILRNRILILTGIALVTVFFGLQWENMRFTRSEANLLPDDHPVNLQYTEFLELFGEEGNAIVLGIRDSALFTPKNFNRWNTLSKQLAAFPEISFVISTDNLKELVKDKDGQ